MPVNVQWLLEKRVIHAQYSGDVSPEDVRYQYDTGIAMCNESDAALVHMIADVNDVTSYPMNFKELKGSFDKKAENAGWVVLVGENKFLRFISSVVGNVMNLRFAYVNTWDEALHYLADRDPHFTYDELKRHVDSRTT